MTKEKPKRMLESLVQNHNFRVIDYEKLPSIDFVYPSYTMDGNSEAFRFDESLRYQLSKGEESVRISLRDKKIAFSNEESLLLEVGQISPRLGLKEQLSREINSIYSYKPVLLIGTKNDSFISYVIKPIITYHMAWFELNPQENEEIESILIKKSEEKPYRGFLQRNFLDQIKYTFSKLK